MQRPLNQLKNIGVTVAQRLQEIGVNNEAELRALGSVRAYQLMEAQNPGITLPVCYYLFSLEGALLDLHWDHLPRELKEHLEGQVRPNKKRRKKS